jgi:glutamate--cysteine ligase
VELTHKTQVQAVQNFKNAAHYDLKTVKIALPDGAVGSVVDLALQVLARMKDFYRDFPASVLDVLTFEEGKFLDPEQRYAWQVRERFSGSFVQKGLELAERRQQEAVQE